MRKWRKANPKKSKALDARYKLKHPEKVKAKNRLHNLRKYELTPEEYDVMHTVQNGLCAICGLPQRNTRRLEVDHNHVTKKVRKLLCTSCNRGMGFFFDDPDLLHAAAAYLRDHAEA